MSESERLISGACDAFKPQWFPYESFCSRCKRSEIRHALRAAVARIRELEDALEVIADKDWIAMLEAIPLDRHGHKWTVDDFVWQGDHHEDARYTAPARFDMIERFAKHVLAHTESEGDHNGAEQEA